MKLPGRLASHVPVPEGSSDSDGLNHPTTSVPRLHHKLQEVSPAPGPGRPVPRLLVRFQKGKGISDGRRVHNVTQCAQLLLSTPRPQARSWMRFLGLVANLDQVNAPQGQPITSHRKNGQGVDCPQMLDAACQHSTRVEIPRNSSIVHPHHRCFQSWMGSSLAGHSTVRHLVSFTGPTPHKLGGTVGYPYLALRKLRRGLRGQTVLVKCDNMSVVMYINKQGGVRSRSLCLQTVRLLQWCHRHKIVLRAAHLPRVENKFSGRPITEVVLDSRQAQNHRVISRVASEASRVPGDLQPPSKASNRPLCQLSESPAPNVLQLGLRPRSLRSGRRRPDNQLVHDPGIRLSTDRLIPRILEKLVNSESC